MGERQWQQDGNSTPGAKCLKILLYLYPAKESGGNLEAAAAAKSQNFSTFQAWPQTPVTFKNCYVGISSLNISIVEIKYVFATGLTSLNFRIY